MWFKSKQEFVVVGGLNKPIFGRLDAGAKLTIASHLPGCKAQN
jgi:hypothetical protein